MYNRRASLSEGHTDQDEGFGPGADLVISVLALMIVMMTVLRATSVMALGGDFDPRYVSLNKREFVAALEGAFSATTSSTADDPNVQILSSEGGSMTLQDLGSIHLLSFGEDILFATNSANLTSRGVHALDRLVQALEVRADTFMEIRILGHTDTTGEDGANLKLGADRAIAVYRALFRGNHSLSPTNVLVSAATYGEYSPADRNPRLRFDDERLRAANTREKLASNRRIEISILYRPSPPE